LINPIKEKAFKRAYLDKGFLRKLSNLYGVTAMNPALSPKWKVETLTVDK
jgi:hypothetical protein